LKKFIVFYLIIGLEIKVEKLEIRVLLCHYWKQNFRATEAARKYAKWRAKVSSQIAQRRTGSRDSVSGTPVSKVNHALVTQPLGSEALREAVGANLASSTCRLSAELYSPWMSAVRHLRELGKVKKHCREVLR
jgi:hypothetical protein